jgi:hypothetical protein
MNIRSKTLLSCGLFSSLIYVATDLLASWQYPGFWGAFALAASLVPIVLKRVSITIGGPTDV